MHGEEVINELGEEISKGKGCIVFDFACYFPYADQDFLIFKFKLGEEELEPYKYNHRYPNKDYVTISKKMGRRVSRIGYPVFVDLNEEYFFILEIAMFIVHFYYGICSALKMLYEKYEIELYYTLFWDHESKT